MKTIQLSGYDSTEFINVETGSFSRYRSSEGFFVLESKTWTCTGIALINNFGSITKILTLEQFFNKLQTNKRNLFYKNGKSKFRIMDIDHGTKRIWSKDFKAYEIYSFYRHNDFFNNYKGAIHV